METPLSLVVVGRASDAPRLTAALNQAEIRARPQAATTPDELAAALDGREAELVLLASLAPADTPRGLSVPEVIAATRRRNPALPVIVMADSLEAAQAALAAGAHEVVVHDQCTHLSLAVARARREAAERQVAHWATASVAATHTHYQQLFSGSRRAQLLIDPDSGAIVEANRAAAAYYGRRVADLAGRQLAELCLWPAEQVRAALARAAAAPAGHTFICRQSLASGEAREVELRASLADAPALGRRLLEVEVLDLSERREREREWEALAQLGAALRVAATRADLMSVVITQVLALMGLEAAALVLRDELSGEAVIAQARHWPQATGTRLPSGEGLGGQTLVTGQPLTVALPSEAGDQLGLREALLWREAAAVPLVAQGQTIGALCVGAPAPLNPAQHRLLSALADMAAGAIHRTSLHEQVEQRLQRLAALHAIDVAIASSFDLRVTLNIFLDHLLSQLGVDAGAVLLLNDVAQTLQYAAVRGLSAAVLHQPSPRLTSSPPGQVVLQRASVFLPRLSAVRGPDAAHPPSGEVFASYYGVPLIARGRVQGVLEVFQRTPLNPDGDWVEYLGSLATQAAIAIDNATLFSELQRSNLELNLAYEATIGSWARMLEARGIEAGGHTRRVAERVVALAQSAGLSESELIHLRRGALLHDIGMLGVPEAIALKTTTYSPTDHDLVQRHPIYGFEILAPIAYLRPAIDIPYAHHERWDGSGYPRQLRGERIPLPARLFAVVDVWDALVTERPYREAWPTARAQHYLREQAGQLFDPMAVELFLQNEGLEER